MAKCELCGRELWGVAYRIRLEGADLLVCPSCARGRMIVGTVNFSKPQPSRQPRSTTKLRRKLEAEEVIVEGYGSLVRSAREKMGLTRDMLATMVGEKESIIRRIEAGQLEPTIELARRLEKVLKIKLVEEVVDYGAGCEEAGGYDLTLGDVVEFKE